jgi:hypothetical protein
MAVRQATLDDIDRGGSKGAGTARVVLSGYSPDTGGPSLSLALGEMICERDSRFIKYIDDLDRAIELAENIIDRGSPARTGSGREDIDTYVWCFGPDAVTDCVTAAADYDAADILIPSLASFGSTAGEIAERLAPVGDVASSILVCVNDDWVRVRDIYGFLFGVKAAGSAGMRLQRETTKDDIRRWASVDKTGGRAGLGFTWVEVGGETEWVPGDDYERVVSVLEMVRDGEMSKRQAAAELDTSPRTITRAIEERPDRYGL